MALTLFRRALANARQAATQSLRARLAESGAETVCILTLNDIVRGLRGKYAMPHFTSELDTQAGFNFHFPGKLSGSLKQVLQGPLAPEVDASVERWIFWLFVGRGPSDAEVSEIQAFIRDACNAAVPFTNGHGSLVLDLPPHAQARSQPMHPMLLQAMSLLHHQPLLSKMARLADMDGGLSKERVHELFCEDSLGAVGSLLRTTAQSDQPWEDGEDYGAFLARAVSCSSGAVNRWYHDDRGRTMYLQSLGQDPNTASVRYVMGLIHDGSASVVPWHGTLEGEVIRLRNGHGGEACGRVNMGVPAVRCADGTEWCLGPISAAKQAVFVRLFTMIHAEHTAGSVVTHATALLASVWCDAFTAYAAGTLGFAGPLHGRANQEFVCMLRELRVALGGGQGLPAPGALRAWAAERLAAGQVVYGFGCKHPYPDPRYTLMAEFAEAHGLTDAERFPEVVLALHLGRELPPILQEVSRAASPHPNPDAISGVLLCECLGLQEEARHPAMLAQARAIGALAAASWHRMLGLPIERPLSLHIPLAGAEAE